MMTQPAEQMKQKKIAPALRFPEFSGEWEDKKIGKISNAVTSGSRDWAQYYSDDGAKFVRMTNLSREGIHLLLEDLRFVSIPKGSSEGTRTSLQQGDILISITAELGKIGIIPKGFGEAYINQHTALVRIAENAAAPTFIAYSISRREANIRLNQLNDSGAKAGLNLSTIKNFKVVLPPLPEQQKIAAFLGVVDERVEQLRRKHDLLQTYKKGVMQRIFNQEIRFKGDSDQPFPDWEEKKLGDVCKIIMGSSPPSTSYNTKEDGVPLFQGNADLKNGYSCPRIYTTETTQQCFTDDILMSVRAPVGVFAQCVHEGCIGRGIAAIRATNKSLKTYTYQYLGYFSYKWRALSQGSTFEAVNSSDIKDFPISVPHPNEQSKIADFFSAIDDKISAVGDELSAAQTYKKSLLKQMFV